MNVNAEADCSISHRGEMPDVHRTQCFTSQNVDRRHHTHVHTHTHFNIDPYPWIHQRFSIIRLEFLFLMFRSLEIFDSRHAI